MRRAPANVVVRRRTPRCYTGPNAHHHLTPIGLLWKAVIFRSGAEGIRTPDLRRAKAARYFAGAFRSLQNSCKSPYLLFGALLKVSGYLLGLLHGCCTSLGRTSA